MIDSLSNMYLEMFNKMSANDGLYESTHCLHQQNHEFDTPVKRQKLL